jgi:hypothetical protein
MSDKSPRLRTVNKVKPPYPLNKFPKDFGRKLGKEIIYLLATKKVQSLEGEEWEQIFAKCIGAEWKPSNVGLDDVILNSCAWGAKTIYSNNPENQKTARLISGRNSPAYSFGDSKITNVPPDPLGAKILDIWNERVSAVREKFKHLRTVVLMKSKSFDVFSVFEFETIRYENEKYYWKWNKRGNLEGFNKKDNSHRFTWQPHGSQFTIIEDAPSKRLILRIKKPPLVDSNSLLNAIGFQEDWITIINKND